MTEQKQIGGGKAIASLVLGIIGLVAWFIPLFGLPITIVGIILGAIDMKSDKRKQAIIGVVLCIIGLVATIINIIVALYLVSKAGYTLR